MKENRYIRQTILKDFGVEAQQKLTIASVLVIGVGGLGIPVLQYLNAMGVGTLGMVEQDVIELSNLQRQVLYGEDTIGRPKLEVALEKLQKQNRTTSFKAYPSFLNRSNALEIIANYDVVVDASDNFATRYLVNDACVILKKPFIYGALHSFEGQVSVFNYQGGPTYRCLFPTMPSLEEIPNCNDNGVLGVIPGIVGNLQALETVKVITGIGEVLSGKLLLFNGLNQSYHKINFKLKPSNLNLTILQENYDMEDCETVPEIQAKELQVLKDSNVVIQIVDVRTAVEFNSGHIENSIHIPLNELTDRNREIDMSKKVYVICQSGKRSALAVSKLQKQFANTTFYSILGGMNQYENECS